MLPARFSSPVLLYLNGHAIYRFAQRYICAGGDFEQGTPLQRLSRTFHEAGSGNGGCASG
jgi:hypothetical protein